MATIFKHLYDTGATFLRPSTMETPARQEIYSSTRYGPSVGDVMKVKGFMFQKFNLPIEIIDTIIDAAEYWPHTSTQTDEERSIRAQRDRENQFVVST